MKNTSKNKKLMIAAAVLGAGFLLSKQFMGGKPGNPKVKLITADNQAQVIVLDINGQKYNYPFSENQSYAIGEDFEVFSGPFLKGRTKVFTLKLNGWPIKEVFRIDV